MNIFKTRKFSDCYFSIYNQELNTDSSIVRYFNDLEMNIEISLSFLHKLRKLEQNENIFTIK